MTVENRNEQLEKRYFDRNSGFYVNYTELIKHKNNLYNSKSDIKFKIYYFKT